VTKYSAIRGVFQQPWPGVSPTAILNEEKALGTRLAEILVATCHRPELWKKLRDMENGVPYTPILQLSRVLITNKKFSLP